MTVTLKRKLIEVALPLDAINTRRRARNPSATATRARCTCGGRDPLAAAGR